MEIHWTMLFALEAAGTIAFASSGAMVAIEKNLDLLGIIVLGVITAVGGGMIRDITIGNIPPSLFRNPVYVWMSLITVLLLFLVIRFHPRIMEGRYRSTYEKVMNIFDAVGLGAFTVVGINTAIEAGYGDYRFLAAFLGDIFTYCVTSIQLALAYPSEAGGVAASAVKFLGVFAPTQLPLAVIEGILTVIIVIGLESYAKPELKAIGFLKEAK